MFIVKLYKEIFKLLKQDIVKNKNIDNKIIAFSEYWDNIQKNQEIFNYLQDR